MKLKRFITSSVLDDDGLYVKWLSKPSVFLIYGDVADVHCLMDQEIDGNKVDWC